MNGEIKKTSEQMHVYPLTNTTIYFQFLLLLSSVYYAMLLTNWGTPVYRRANSGFFFNSDNESYWCQIIAMIISIVTYLYSLLAPVFLP